MQFPSADRKHDPHRLLCYLVRKKANPP